MGNKLLKNINKLVQNKLGNNMRLISDQIALHSAKLPLYEMGITYRTVTKALIGGGGGCIFIYLRSAGRFFF